MNKALERLGAFAARQWWIAAGAGLFIRSLGLPPGRISPGTRGSPG